MPDRTCDFTGCGRKHYAKGLCQTHYYQQRAGKPVTTIGTYKASHNKSGCAFGPCDRQATALGLCRAHYFQQYIGKPLAPLKLKGSVPNPETAAGRVCTACGTYKEWAEYYLNRHGRHRAQCKRCVIDQVLAAKTRREADA